MKIRTRRDGETTVTASQPLKGCSDRDWEMGLSIALRCVPEKGPEPTGRHPPSPQGNAACLFSCPYREDGHHGGL
ncbi:hypothetical protein ROHU_001484 [Labeo rohita]|uniref:Uncharacterized protein n=1 Tax=Labeo rohita TaxID=84645 RepID=A0A498P1E7_LABRO|nr:hypothetical protein ROHU_001484 [Labeo rohita]